MTGIERIAAERKRQIEEEGFTAEHDDEWCKAELARAAVCYTTPYGFVGLVANVWPHNWKKEWFKPLPTNQIRNLEKAGALIAAEIDRLLRMKRGE
jgi:hypothetical protein